MPWWADLARLQGPPQIPPAHGVEHRSNSDWRHNRQRDPSTVHPEQQWDHGGSLPDLGELERGDGDLEQLRDSRFPPEERRGVHVRPGSPGLGFGERDVRRPEVGRSEEHTSELQSPCNLVCRLLLEKKTALSANSSL